MSELKAFNSERIYWAEACMHKRWRQDEGFDYARSTRHMNKWLEIAEKFKDKDGK